MIGLVGAQGVGKTTLAREFAGRHGGHYLDASVTKIIREAGFDPSAAGQYDFATRLMLQEIVLIGVERIYDAAPRGVAVITDRTPIDMLGYTLCEAVGNAVPEFLWKPLERYVEHCIEVSNNRFSMLMLVQPGIPLQQDRDGKAVANQPFIEHLNAMYLGFLNDQRMKVPSFYLRREKLEIAERLGALLEAQQRILNMHEYGGAAHIANGGSVH